MGRRRRSKERRLVVSKSMVTAGSERSPWRERKVIGECVVDEVSELIVVRVSRMVTVE